jgi:hypothetical protein
MSAKFRIGLVMAGTISAGAYTAGVVDFLLEALGNWETAKKRERARTPDTERWSIPGHEVDLSVVTGASGGGICAALLAATLGTTIVPVVETPPPSRRTGNVFYDSWVLDAKIEDLLTTSDLDDDPQGSVRSVLNSTPIDKIARSALGPIGEWNPPPYVASPLQFLLTTANLRGVPYKVGFIGGGTHEQDMTLHGDHKHFYVSDAARPPLDDAGATWLDPVNPGQGWDDLRRSAIATSAFPLGLAARPLERSVLGYINREWQVPNPVPGQPANVVAYEAERIPPSCLERGDPPYAFVAVDGGTMNNQPFDLAHAILSEGALVNKRGGAEADRAVLLVDPFAERFDCSAPYRERTDVVSVMGALLIAFAQQARFRPEDLVLAQREDVFSRFLIAPVRRRHVDSPREKFPLAGRSLGGFGGFLAEAFRKHDFQLGRLNCRLFLEKSFLLYAENPLFDGWSDAAKSGFTTLDEDPVSPGQRRRFRPIIPLVDSGPATTAPPIWPRFSTAELDRVTHQIGTRLDAIVARLRHVYLRGLLESSIAHVGWLWKRTDVIGGIREYVAAELRQRSLMKPAETTDDI